MYVCVCVCVCVCVYIWEGQTGPGESRFRNTPSIPTYIRDM